MAADITAPDLVVAPGLDDDLATSFAEMRPLESASHPIDQVCRRAGYSDPAAFRRVFKQATGLLPGAYRDAYGLRGRPGN